MARGKRCGVKEFGWLNRSGLSQSQFDLTGKGAQGRGTGGWQGVNLAFMGGRVGAGKIECSRVQNVRGLVGVVELVEAIECSWKQLQECQASRGPSAATIDEYSSINKGKVCRYGVRE